MTPSEVLLAENTKRFSGTLGCAELEKAAECVVNYLSGRGDEWSIGFPLKHIRSKFAGSEDQWSLCICHRHSLSDTKNCMLVDWLTPCVGGVWRVSPDFVSRVSRGRAISMSVLDAACVRLYCKVARQTPGLTITDVKLVTPKIVDMNGNKYVALIDGFEVYVYIDQVDELTCEFEVMLSEASDDQTEFNCEGVKLSRDQVEDLGSGNSQAEIIAELLMQTWEVCR